MDKFTDGFSEKSYDDLLNEYAGESFTNKPNRRETTSSDNTPKKSADKNIYSGNNNTRPKQTVYKPVTPVVNNSVPARTETKPVVKRPAQAVTRTADQSKPKSKSIDLREIKSFDEEINGATKNPPQKKPKAENNDTMEFKKGKLNLSRMGKPVIDKSFSAEEASNKNKQPLKNKLVKALKVNKKIFISFAVCVVLAVLVSTMLISCVNDVLAIGRDSETSVEVVLPNDANTNTAINVLKDAGLIKNKLFCKVFIKAMGYSDENYLPGVYYFTENMGVEKMIKRFKTSSTRGALISITIPEGYTIDKIFERLEKNNVCTAASLYKTIDEVDFSSEYDFIPKASSKAGCYHILEGYFFPATYEFEQGADPATVVRTFLNAFKSHWTEDYAKRAEELGMSVDEIVTLASIIEKEGANSSQFSQVSSVIHNRLNRSGLYPFLGCDSTKDYVTNTISARVTSKSELNAYIQNYNTYEREGLPIGAICNPGEAAIEAALNPDSSQYYFFAHDNNKKIYLAETMEQHDQNRKIIAQVNAQSK